MASFTNSEAKGEQDVQSTFSTHGRVGTFVAHHSDRAFVRVFSVHICNTCHGPGVQHGCAHDCDGRHGSVERFDKSIECHKGLFVVWSATGPDSALSAS